MILCQLHEAGEGLANKVLLEWALDVLHFLEDWRWLWSPEPAMTPSLSPTPQNHLPHPPLYDVSNANPWTMYAPNAPSTSAPSAEEQLLDTLNTLVPCTCAQSVESLVMWVPAAQPQLQHAHPLSLPEWVTSEDFESEPQGYDRGNVMVEEAPISFSPFTMADCTLFSHFPFNDFIAIAFPDLAEDLNTQI